MAGCRTPAGSQAPRLSRGLTNGWPRKGASAGGNAPNPSWPGFSRPSTQRAHTRRATPASPARRRHCMLSSQRLEKPGAAAHMRIMHIPHLHDWTVTPREAIALQKQLAGRLVLDRPLDLSSVRHVAGVDVSVREGLSRAAVVVLSFPDLRVVETVLADAPTPFPYVPGLLTFREGPVLEEAFARLETEPDAFIFDGAGCAHPRGIGVASHMGLWLGRPSVGCAKTRTVAGGGDGVAGAPADISGSGAAVHRRRAAHPRQCGAGLCLAGPSDRSGQRRGAGQRLPQPFPFARAGARRPPRRRPDSGEPAGAPGPVAGGSPFRLIPHSARGRRRIVNCTRLSPTIRQFSISERQRARG